MKQKKILILPVLLLLCAALLLVFTACGEEDDTGTGKIVVSFYTDTANPKAAAVVASYKPENLTAGSVFLSLIPTRSGYAFTGLYDSPTGGIQVVNEKGLLNVAITKDVTLYAQWTGQECTLVLDPGEGTLPGNENRLTITWGEVVPQFPVPTREGYEFVGWYSGDDIVLSDEQGHPHPKADCFDEKYPVTAENNRIVLTAHYKIKQLKLVLDFNDGTYEARELSCEYGSYPDPKDFPTRDAEGRELVGWSRSRGANEPFTGKLTEDTTLYAVWREYREISFYPQPDGTPETLRVYRDADAMRKAAPERAGYRFCGWYNNKLYSGNPAETFSFGSAYDAYYAMWEPITYKITFSSDSGETFPEMTYTVESDSLTLPTCTKDYYEFLGWCTDRNGKGTVYRTLPAGQSGDLKFYAIFRGVERRVVLDPGDGTLSKTTATVRYGEDFVLPVPTPTDSGYAFAGWYLVGGGIVADAKGNGIVKWRYTDEETQLVARYSKKYYVRVTPSIEGAAECEVDDYYAQGQEVRLQAKLKPGYTLVGWYIGDAKVGNSETYQTWMNQTDIELELRVAPKTFRITLKPGEDAFCKTLQATATFGESYRLPVPYRQGYKFLYWQIDANAGSEAVKLTNEDGASLSAYPLTYDITVSAVYIESDEDEILIKNKNDFLAIKNKPDGRYVLLVDLDMSGVTWVPFDFSGVLRGNGCTIKNLTVSSESGNLGVFLKLSGTLSDITFENLAVTSTSYTQVLVGGVCAELTGTMRGVSVSGNIIGDFCRMGTMAGKMSGGTMEDCHSSATVRTETYETDISVGGLIGWQTGGTVSNCENTGRVTAGQSTGGVIGWANGGTQTKLKNSGTVTGTINVGGVIGCHQQAGAYTLVFAFENTGKVTGKEKVGGLIGNYYNSYNPRSDSAYTTKISRLTNSGEVTGEKQVGGVIGYMQATATYGGWSPSMILYASEFTNTGKVTGETQVGGLVGYGVTNNGGSALRNSSSSGEVAGVAIVGGLAGQLDRVRIVDCRNTGVKVTASGYDISGSDYRAFLGGYVGYGYQVENCVNAVDITYESNGAYVGGIAGYLSGGVLISCKNSGRITAAQASFVGGLAGEINCPGQLTVGDNQNSGAVTGKNYVGGVVGRFYDSYSPRSDSTYNTKLSKFSNSGTVTGEQYVGGIFGYLHISAQYGGWSPSMMVTVTGFTAEGTVTGKNYVGGMFGYAYANNSGSVMRGCIMSGSVTAEAIVGGIAGKLDNIKLVECKLTETASVTATGSFIENSVYYAYFGGLVGWGYQIENCENNTDISYTGRGSHVGGLAGRLSGSTMTGCKNHATVSAPNSDYVGGLAGEINCGGILSLADCENTGAVTGKNHTGGLFGRIYNYYSARSDSGYMAAANRMTNSGAVTGADNVGGIAGSFSLSAGWGGGWNPSLGLNASVWKNTGAVTGSYYVGGLVGHGATQRNDSVISLSESHATVIGSAVVGGLAGQLDNITLRECSNSDSTIEAQGKLTVDTKDYAYLGGYVGYGYSLENCHNAVSLTYSLSASHVGGLAGRLSGPTVKDCSNSGVISAGQSDYTGGLVGELSTGSPFTLTDLTNTGRVQGHDYTGGLFGRAYAGYNTRSDSAFTATVARLTNNGAVSGNQYVAGLMGQLVATAWWNSSWHPSIIVSASEWHNCGDVTAQHASTVAGLVFRVETNNAGSKLTNYSNTGLLNGSSASENALFGSATNFTVAEQS